MKNTYQDSDIKKLSEILKFDAEREVYVDIYDNKIMEFNKTGEVIYILIPTVKVKSKPIELEYDGIKLRSPDYKESKGFIVILRDDRRFVRISIENLKPKDSDHMKACGFNIVFDDNKCLRCIEDIDRGYSIGYAPWSAQITSFRSPYFKWTSFMK